MGFVVNRHLEIYWLGFKINTKLMDTYDTTLHWTFAIPRENSHNHKFLAD